MTSIAMPHRDTTAVRSPLPTERGQPPRWYLAGALGSFVVALVGAQLLELHHDLFLLAYTTVAGRSQSPGELA